MSTTGLIIAVPLFLAAIVLLCSATDTTAGGLFRGFFHSLLEDRISWMELRR